MFEDMCLTHGSKAYMRKQIDAELTRAVKKRHDQLKAVDNFHTYLMTGLGKPHLLTEMDSCYGIHVTANWRLVIKPQVESLDVEALQRCDAILIKGVVDYHGKGSKNNWLIP